MGIPLSIGIVTYNSEEDIASCLGSLLENVRLRPLEIIVVDNGSVDTTAEQIQAFARKASGQNARLAFRRNPANVGFTRAVNQAWRMSHGTYFLLLNPDCRVQDGAVERLVQFLGNHPDAGAVAPQLRFPDGSIQPSCRRFPLYRYVLFEVLGLSRLFPRSPLLNGWKMGDFDHNSLAEVDQPQGACLLVRRQAMQDIGSMDERFFLFFSDVDLCRQLKIRGWKIFFYPGARVIHRKGTTIYRNRVRTIWLSHLDFVRYFLKWYRKPHHWLFHLIGIPFLFSVGLLRMLAAWMAQRGQSFRARSASFRE
jgi:hypothetical protein